MPLNLDSIWPIKLKYSYTRMFIGAVPRRRCLLLFTVRLRSHSVCNCGPCKRSLRLLNKNNSCDYILFRQPSRRAAFPLHINLSAPLISYLLLSFFFRIS